MKKLFIPVFCVLSISSMQAKFTEGSVYQLEGANPNKPRLGRMFDDGETYGPRKGMKDAAKCGCSNKPRPCCKDTEESVQDEDMNVFVEEEVADESAKCGCSKPRPNRDMDSVKCGCSNKPRPCCKDTEESVQDADENALVEEEVADESVKCGCSKPRPTKDMDDSKCGCSKPRPTKDMDDAAKCGCSNKPPRA